VLAGSFGGFLNKEIVSGNFGVLFEISMTPLKFQTGFVSPYVL
jgi:hypothetical protein